MTNFFIEPAINSEFKVNLEGQVLSAYKKALKTESFWNYFSPRFFVPVFCLVIFAGFVVFKNNLVSNESSLEKEILLISQELNGDVDIQNALSFTESVTN